MHFSIKLLYFTSCLYLIQASEILSAEIPRPNSQCPQVDDVNRPILLSYPKDCSKYYSCSQGLAYVQQCPDNLLWNPIQYRCDYPENVQCEQEFLSAESPVAHPQCRQLDGANHPMLFSYPKDCSKYYSCSQGLAYAKQCPGNFHWNPLEYRCDFPENVVCEKSEITTSLPIVAQPTKDFVYQYYPNDCQRYYQCQVMSCPSLYHWNSNKQQCDFPHLAQCPFRPTVIPTLPPITEMPAAPTAATVPTTTMATPPHGQGEVCNECVSWCMGQGHIYLPYPTDCSKFIQCNGLAFIHKCPDQLLWNDKLKTCDRFCIRNDKEKYVVANEI